MNQNAEIICPPELWENSMSKRAREKILKSDEWQTARQFYFQKYPQFFSRSQKFPDLRELLERGSADFDKTSDSAERPAYRALAYIYQHMAMHLRQNLALLNHYKGTIFAGPGPLLFLDFGCGPMTGGIALHDIAKLARATHAITYVGVDASQSMVNLAEQINETHRFFETIKAKRFLLYQRNYIHPPPPEEGLKGRWNIMILNLSFVLAPDTYKFEKGSQQAAARTLVQNWKKWIQAVQPRDMIVLYLNPEETSYHKTHENWRRVTAELGTTNTPSGYMLLSPPQDLRIMWKENENRCYSGFIHWRK